MSGPFTQKPRLSVVTIVRDAEQELARTIESIRGLADEIIVCDTGSEDATVTTATRLATKVLQCDWTDDFSAARNACLEHVTGDWILWLDAGEWIDPDGAAGLRALIDSQPRPSTAFLLPVKVPASTPQSAAEQVAQIRLVPNRADIRFDGRVRETLDDSLAAAGISVEGLQCDIQRGPREHDPVVKARRARRNLRLTDLAIQEDGSQARWLNCRAEAFADLDDHTEAARLFRQAIKSCDEASADMLAAYYGLLSSLDGLPDAATVQISVCLQALETFPTDAQLLCALGSYLQSQGRGELALRSYETAYRFGQVNPAVWHLQKITSFVAICYSRALQLYDRPDEAEQVLLESLEHEPESLPLHRRLLESLVAQGRTKEALTQLDYWPVELPNPEALRTAVRGAALASQKNWLAAQSHLQTAYDAGCRHPLCLRWLSLTLWARQHYGHAEPVLREWAAADPADAEPQRYLAALDQVRSPAVTAAPETSPPNTSHTGSPSSSPGASELQRRIDEVLPGVRHVAKPAVRFPHGQRAARES